MRHWHAGVCAVALRAPCVQSSRRAPGNVGLFSPPPPSPDPCFFAARVLGVGLCLPAHAGPLPHPFVRCAAVGNQLPRTHKLPPKPLCPACVPPAHAPPLPPSTAGPSHAVRHHVPVCVHDWVPHRGGVHCVQAPAADHGGPGAGGQGHRGHPPHEPPLLRLPEDVPETVLPGLCGGHGGPCA